MIALYKQEWQIFREHYARIFIWVLAVCLVSAILTYVLLVSQPEVATQTMQMVGEQLQKQAESFGGVLDGSNSDLFLFIVKNNLYVSTIVFLLGFIPVVILPLLSPFVTMLSIGIMLAGFKVLGENPMQALILGILPHGIVEIIAIILAGSIGCFVSLHILKKIFSPNRNNIPLLRLIGQAARTFALVVVPLVVLAALIEGFITPELLKMAY